MRYDAARHRGTDHQQRVLDYRLQERAAWLALQEVAQRLLSEPAPPVSPTPPPRRFSTSFAYAQAYRTWHGARYALDLALVPLRRAGEPSPAPPPRLRAGRAGRRGHG
jgi:hypothetical protein